MGYLKRHAYRNMPQGGYPWKPCCPPMPDWDAVKPLIAAGFLAYDNETLRRMVKRLNAKHEEGEQTGCPHLKKSCRA